MERNPNAEIRSHRSKVASREVKASSAGSGGRRMERNPRRYPNSKVRRSRVRRRKRLSHRSKDSSQEVNAS